MRGSEALDNDVLVIVPCSARKIWDKEPQRGPTPAKNAYTGPLFRLARRFAEIHNYPWIILSAKYGFIEPDYIIPENYNVTFNDLKTNPVTVDVLRRQVEEKKLHRYKKIIVLGGKHYVDAVRKAFQGYDVDIEAPLEGLPVGEMLRKLKIMASK